MGNVTGNSSFSINTLRADFWQVYSCQKVGTKCVLQFSSYHEIDILCEGSAHSGMAEVGNEVETFCAQFFHTSVGVVNATMLLGKLDEVGNVGGCGFTLLDTLRHGEGIGIGRVGEGIDDGEGELSLAHVVAAGFAHAFIVIVVEDVVADLEAHPYPIAEAAHALKIGGISSHGERGEGAAGFKEGGSFPTDDAVVGGF